MSAVTALTQPKSKAFNKQQQLNNAGEILSYPYSFDQEVPDEAAMMLDKKLAKMKMEEQYRVAELQN